MNTSENILIAMFIQNYDKMTQAIEGDTHWLNQLACINCALNSLIDAKDHLCEINRFYIYNTLTIAMSFEKRYANSRDPEVESLKSYLETLSKLSIKREDFKRK